MDMQYIYFAGVAAIAVGVGLLTMYRIYRRGIAIRLTVIVILCALTAAIVSFMLGREGITVATAGIALVIVIPVVLGLLISLVRQIITPTKQMVSVADALARGESDQRVDHRSNDEIGALADAFRQTIGYQQAMANAASGIASGNLSVAVRPKSDKDELGNAFVQMIAYLREMATTTRQAAQSVSSASTEILATVSQHTASANEQSAAVNQTTATVDELRASAEQTARQAGNVAQLAQTSAQAGQDGAQSVEAILRAMTDIRAKVEGIAQDILTLSEHTQQIGEITTTVNDIADQSNILALNAAIEAAKAGEQGKGFAVVAAEVRNLAEQSKQATARVRTILGDIQKATNAAVLATEQGARGVETGTTLAQRAGEVITRLAGDIRDAAQSSQQIAAAAHQQSSAMDQIAQAMREINQATVQFVAGARQSQSAAESLTNLSRQLQALTEKYKLAA